MRLISGIECPLPILLASKGSYGDRGSIVPNEAAITPLAKALIPAQKNG
jgi:hypothetical protein